MTATRDTRFADDRGSLIPEFALAVPLMIFLVLGIFEFGMAWRNSNILASIVRGGARTAGQMQDNPQADRVALDSYMGSVGQMKRATTQKVIIYRVNASNANGAVPPACRTVSTAGAPPYGINTGINAVQCNVYIPSQLTSANLVSSNFGCASGDYDSFFCPTGRSKALGTPASAPASLGFYAEVGYDLITGLIGSGTITMKDKATYRIEPVAT
jgi:Flp pilus assembly protein TadG